MRFGPLSGTASIPDLFKKGVPLGSNPKTSPPSSPGGNTSSIIIMIYLQSWSKVVGMMLTEYEITTHCFISRLSWTSVGSYCRMPPCPRINVGVSRWPLRTVCSWYSNIDSGEGGNWYRPNTFDHDCWLVVFPAGHFIITCPYLKGCVSIRGLLISFGETWGGVPYLRSFQGHQQWSLTWWYDWKEWEDGIRRGGDNPWTTSQPMGQVSTVVTSVTFCVQEVCPFIHSSIFYFH